MLRKLPLILVLAAGFCSFAQADELTQVIQQDLVRLGYDPGNIDGEATVQTVIAISKFQSEHGLEVTGEPSPQLAGIIKASIGQAPAVAGPVSTPAPAAAASVTAPVAAPASQDPAALAAAQQACLQQRMVEAQEASQRKRGFARLARAVTRATSNLGGNEISRDIAELSSDVYTAQSVAGDFAAAAEELGLTESDIEACRNPS